MTPTRKATKAAAGQSELLEPHTGPRVGSMGVRAEQMVDGGDRQWTNVSLAFESLNQTDGNTMTTTATGTASPKPGADKCPTVPSTVSTPRGARDSGAAMQPGAEEQRVCASSAEATAMDTEADSEEQQAHECGPVAGQHAPDASASESVSQMDGHHSTNDATGSATRTPAMPSAASAPRGTAASGASRPLADGILASIATPRREASSIIPGWAPPAHGPYSLDESGGVVVFEAPLWTEEQLAEAGRDRAWLEMVLRHSTAYQTVAAAVAAKRVAAEKAQRAAREAQSKAEAKASAEAYLAKSRATQRAIDEKWAAREAQREAAQAAQAAEVVAMASTVGSIAHFAGPRPFTPFHRGRLPDVHLPFELRFDHRQWDTLVLYDKWLRGDALQVDDMDESFIEDGDPQGEAGRVTWLLNRVLPKYFYQPEGVSVDARLPAAGQLAAFTRYRWASPPSACKLMRRMVEYVESHRLPGVEYAYSKKEYFKQGGSTEVTIDDDLVSDFDGNSDSDELENQHDMAAHAATRGAGA